MGEREKIAILIAVRALNEPKGMVPHLVVVHASHVVVLVVSCLEQKQRLVPLDLNPQLLLFTEVTAAGLE